MHRNSAVFHCSLPLPAILLSALFLSLSSFQSFITCENSVVFLLLVDKKKKEDIVSADYMVLNKNQQNCNQHPVRSSNFILNMKHNLNHNTVNVANKNQTLPQKQTKPKTKKPTKHQNRTCHEITESDVIYVVHLVLIFI